MLRLYEAAVKRVAYDYYTAKTAILDMHQCDEFPDPEDNAAYQYAKLICETDSDVWRDRLQEYPRFGENVLGFLKWSEIRRYILSPIKLTQSR